VKNTVGAALWPKALAPAIKTEKIESPRRGIILLNIKLLLVGPFTTLL
jgi:hypothetical protein